MTHYAKKMGSNQEIARKIIHGTLLILKTGDLTDEPADAIVNAANTQLLAGAGVSGAIRAKAGPAPFDECQAILRREGISAICTGEARLTGPGTLPIKGIIHAAGPRGTGEEELRAAYRNSLRLAHQAAYKTIAFPSISTGIFGYPLAEAAPAALDEISQYLKAHPSAFEAVIFVFLKNDETARAYSSILT